VWAAWVLPYDRPILLVGDERADLDEARRSLIRVGLDDIAGYLRGGIGTWIEAGYEQAHIPQISVQELRRKQKSGQSLFILDVRSRGEWMAGHIEGAIHIPGGELPKRTAEVPRNIPVHVICGSGYRSSVAASVLKRAGFEQIVNVAGGMAAWDSQALPAASGR
jgi:hydroxyacylglutathione hydrolase